MRIWMLSLVIFALAALFAGESLAHNGTVPPPSPTATPPEGIIILPTPPARTPTPTPNMAIVVHLPLVFDQ